MYKSSSNELDRFIGSHVWEDLSEELEKLVEASRDDLEGSLNYDEVCRSQGRLDMARRILLWPEVTRDELEEQQREREDTNVNGF